MTIRLAPLHHRQLQATDFHYLAGAFDINLNVAPAIRPSFLRPATQSQDGDRGSDGRIDDRDV